MSLAERLAHCVLPGSRRRFATIVRLLPVALMLVAGAAAAQNTEGPALRTEPLPEPCETTGAADSCARVLACVGEEGLWFEGRAIGWNRGRLEGRLSNGATCTGDWAYIDGRTSRTAFACEDGTEGFVLAIAQDPPTGTAIAEGTTIDGRRITAWSGAHVLDFLRKPGGDPVLPCGKQSIVIG